MASLDEDYVTFPHCDPHVLHQPTVCLICDKYAAKLQEVRIRHGINFTGEHDPNKKPCPAEKNRPLERIEKWGGNRPA